MRLRALITTALLICTLIGDVRAADITARSFTLPAEKGSTAPPKVTLLHFSPNGQRLAVGGVNYFALLDSDTLRPVAEAGQRSAERQVEARIDRGELMVSVNGKSSRRDWVTGRPQSGGAAKTGYDIGLATDGHAVARTSPPPVRRDSPIIDAGPGHFRAADEPLDPGVANTIVLTPRGPGPVRLFVARLPRGAGGGLRRPHEFVSYSLSPSGKYVAGVIKAGFLYIWDVAGNADGRVVGAGASWETVSSEGSRRITWLDNERIIAVNGPEALVRYDVATGEVLSAPNVLVPVEESKRFTPAESEVLPDPQGDGRRFMSPDGKVTVEFANELLDPRGNSDRKRPVLVVRADADRPPVGNVLLPDDNKLGYFVYSPDGKRIAASFASGAIVVVSTDELLAGAARGARLTQVPVARVLVDNPVFASWRAVDPGGYAEFEVTLTEQGATHTRTLRVTLEERIAGEGLRTSVRDLSRPVEPRNGDVPVSVSTALTVPTRVTPAQAQSAILPQGEGFVPMGTERVTAAGREFTCTKFERKSSVSGHSSTERVWIATDAPGLVVKRESDSASPTARRTETTILRSIVARK